MASPAVDGAAVNSGSHSTGTTSFVLPALSTSVANDEVIVVVGQSAPNGPVASISSAHLTFTKRWLLGPSTGLSEEVQLEVWAAPATGMLSSEVITVTLSAAPSDGTCVAAFAVGGSATSPWDPGLLLPASEAQGVTNGTSPGALSVTTSNADDLLLMFVHGTNSTGGGIAAPSGWTQLVSFTNFSAGVEPNMQVHYKSVSSVQAGASVTPGVSAGGQVVYVAIDALTADVSIKPNHQGVIVGA